METIRTTRTHTADDDSTVEIDAEATGRHVNIVVAINGILQEQPWYTDDLAYDVTRSDLETLADEALAAHTA